MNLASTLSQSVDRAARERGKVYFANGRVFLTSCDGTRVEAQVSGSQRYSVSLRREQREVWASCSCPYAAGGEPCKHIWAVVLAADAKHGLRGVRGALPKWLFMDFDADLDEGFDLDLEEEEEPWEDPPAVRSQGRRRVSPPPPPAAPDWRQRLSGLTAPASPAPAPPLRGRGIFYLLNLAATLQQHRIAVQIWTGVQSPDGKWTEVAPLSLSQYRIPDLPEASDRECLSLLASFNGGGFYGSPSYSSYSPQIPAACEIPSAAAGVVIPKLCATGRFSVRQQEDAGLLLTWDGGAPWEIWLEVTEEAAGACKVAASLRRGDERMDPGAALLLGRSGYLLAGGRIAAVAEEAFHWASLLPAESALRVPARERDDLLAQLLAAPHLPRLALPASMQVEEVAVAPRPLLRLLPPDWPGGWPRAELAFLYGGRETPAASPSRGVYEPESRRFLLRDAEAERRSADRLPELGFRPTSHAVAGSLQIAAGKVAKAVPPLLAEGWAVEAEGKLYRTGGQFQMSVSSGVDWFDLEGEADFEGETVALPELLAAIRKGARFIPLGDGSLGMLPEEWVRKLSPLARLAEVSPQRVRFRPIQTVLLDAWLAEETAGFSTACDAAFERARRRLREFAGIAPAGAPPGFRGELRPYQRAGLGWLHFLRDFGFGGCLADDMGLGKTVQVLALLEARRTRRKRDGLPPSLAVVPRSLVFNWMEEAARFTPRLRVLDYTGAGRARDGDPFAEHDLVVTTYGTLRKDVAALREAEFDYLILDEAQAIKNASSQTAKAARLLRGRHRLALTGTPVENHLGELWSLLEFLNPGFLGASPTFRPLAGETRAPLGENRGMLARALRPLLLRRTKEQVAPELPAKVEQTVFCELPAKQRKLYDELRDHYRASLGRQIGDKGLGRAKILVLEALLRLRQAACHPGLLDSRRAGEPCAKLDLLVPQLREVLEEGHKALVFSQFTSFLALLRAQLDAQGVFYQYLDGQTRDRAAKVEAFQNDPGQQLFLISLKAGGLGLNLTAADYVYLLDPWWNPAVEAQAIDRAHRIGQQRPVFASRIVARDTVEEKILELQASKRDLADAVIQADKSLLAALSREDLELLLS
jgi:superfamily II DNA or RNA helicase